MPDLERHRRLFVRRLLAWGRSNRRSFPWREEQDPFKILVAEILLQRSRGKTVARIYAALFARWPTAEALSKAPLTEIEEVIRPLGLLGRAKTLQKLAREISEVGDVPRSVTALKKLPGVGEYAAKAASAAAFHSFEPVVDSVTARVYRRFFGLESVLAASADRTLWSFVERVSGRNAHELNWAVLDLAALICLPKSPSCSHCPLLPDCEWEKAHAAGTHL